MAIDQAQTRNIAKLAALTVDTQQEEHLTQELNAILDLVKQIQNIDTVSVAPLSHPLEIQQVMRADQVTETDQHSVFQRLAAKVEADLYLVPRVMT